nr:ferrochelatase [Lactococcus sp. dk101]
MSIKILLCLFILFRSGSCFVEKSKGVLLVGLGTPQSCEVDDVRAYLKEFLSDPLVIQKPRWFWLPLLNGIILKVRPAKSAEMYKKVWRENGSPLMEYTINQTEQLNAICEDYQVDFAMTYGQPRIDDKIAEMRANGITDLTVLPLYPQYSLTTVEPIVRQVAAVDPNIPVIKEFCQLPSYTDLLAETINEKWATGAYDKLVLSYHGIPVSYVTKKQDIYEEQCKLTTAAVVEKLGLSESQYEHDYQSKFGPDKWLGPATIDRMASLPKEGCKKVLICSPAFVADCLETLYELEIENKDVFVENGGEVFDFVHPFNESAAFTEVLKEVVLEANK